MPPSSHFRFRIRKFCPRRPALRILHVLLLLLLCFSSFVFVFRRSRPRWHSTNRDDGSIPYMGTFRLVDDLLDEALLLTLSYAQDGRLRSASVRGADAHASPSRASTYRVPFVSSALQVDLDTTLRAQACQILRGKSVLLVGPHETLFQLHSYLLRVLHPDPILGSTIAPTMRPSSCPGGSLSYSCPSHPLCYLGTKLPPQSSSHLGSDINYDFQTLTSRQQIARVAAASYDTSTQEI